MEEETEEVITDLVIKQPTEATLFAPAFVVYEWHGLLPEIHFCKPIHQIEGPKLIKVEEIVGKVYSCNNSHIP
jgi:hypothetical protein